LATTVAYTVVGLRLVGGGRGRTCADVFTPARLPIAAIGQN